MPFLSPDYYVTDVHAIDLDALRSRGVRGLLLDLDNTILPRDTNEVPEEWRSWTSTLAERGFHVCLVSNNWHERVRIVADDLGFDLVGKAVKPLPFAFWRATRRIGLRVSECAVVGDQLFTDILGGRLVGAVTVLVRPLSTADLPHTLLLRRLEARIMKGAEPEGPCRKTQGADLK
jgi:HAD superfamily phosphatase (TIGR01668 family)